MSYLQFQDKKMEKPLSSPERHAILTVKLRGHFRCKVEGDGVRWKNDGESIKGLSRKC